MATGVTGSSESILETPTYGIALVLLLLQAISIIFSAIVYLLRHQLRKRQRLGMLAAVNHSVSELTLLGFVSLCLIALQGPITSICVDPGYFDSSWTVLSHVYNENFCPCCLENTKNVQQCVQEYAKCGNPVDPFCNCDNKDPTCVANVSYIDYLDGALYAPQPEGRRLLAEESGNEGSSRYECEGPVTLDSQGCPEGKIRAISFLVLEQLHLLIFTMSIIHVVCGFVLYGISMLRVRLEWKNWEKEEDPHVAKVEEALQPYFENLNVALVRRSMTRRPPEGEDSPGPEVQEQANGGKQLHQASSAPELESKRDMETGDHARKEEENITRGHSAGLPRWLTSESRRRITRTLTRSANSFRHLLEEHGYLKMVYLRSKNFFKWFGKGVCYISINTIQGLGPSVVSKQQYMKMRASFIYTHKMGKSFNFYQHVTRSMEEDLSMIVGLTPIFWIVTIIFWLISGPIGYAVMPAMIINAIVVITLNSKLVHIVKKVTETSSIAMMLSAKIFWFNKPQLLLLPMKFSLFMCSFIYGSFLFFVWQFSPNSCPFTDSFYPQWVIPWWTIIIFNTVIFVHLAAVTFPAYSMAVQMGSDLKSHMLPKRLARKLLAAVQDAKNHLKEQKAVEKALHRRSKSMESGSGGAKNPVFSLARRSMDGGSIIGGAVQKAFAHIVEGEHHPVREDDL